MLLSGGGSAADCFFDAASAQRTSLNMPQMNSWLTAESGGGGGGWGGGGGGLICLHYYKSVTTWWLDAKCKLAFSVTCWATAASWLSLLTPLTKEGLALLYLFHLCSLRSKHTETTRAKSSRKQRLTHVLWPHPESQQSGVITKNNSREWQPS